MICPGTQRKTTTKRTTSSPYEHNAAKRTVPLVIISALFALALPALAQAECPNKQLRQNPRVSNTDPTTGQPYDINLPDCRAYEQVSPPEKDGGSGGVFYFDSVPVSIYGFPLQSLADGSEITYPGEPFFDEGSVTHEEIEHERSFHVQYTSARTPEGWRLKESGNSLASEKIPFPTIPNSVAHSPEILEESSGGTDIFYTEAGDLYEYQISSGTSTDLTPNVQPGGADVQGLLGVGGEGAEEGSYVYFVAGGALAPQASESGCVTTGNKASGTGCNLYLRHDGVTTFIATLSPDDEGGGFFGTTSEDWSSPSSRTAEVSPSGRYVAFDSNYELNREADEGAKSFPGGSEIFRYAAESKELTCVSCLPGTSSEPDGPPLTGGALNLVSTMTEPNGAGRQRYVLNDGRVLFDTPNILVPQDINLQTDVYEWEPAGIGSCDALSEQFSNFSKGCVALISGGTSELSDAVLADASASGSDVFFTTSQSLVSQDKDEITDLYDAREGGGFPPPQESACPLGSACPGTAGVSAAFGVPPASATFSGTEGVPVEATIKPGEKQKTPTRRQKLAKALKACHVKRNRKKRDACEAIAQRRYRSTRKVN
jgi:hypothetical protein